jgi:hypothetical protein
MTDRELMKQALEALQYASEETKPENLHGCDCLICKTILALRERLAQPEIPYVIDCPRCGHCCPQRPWTGLTEDEIALIVGDCAASHLHDDFSFAREIEGKLREKNT